MRIYLKIDKKALKLLAICVLSIYYCVFFIPNSLSHSWPHHFNENNSVISGEFSVTTCLVSLPARLSISSHSLNKLSKLTLFKESAIVSSLSMALFCIIVMQIERPTLYLAKISSCYSLAPPVA